MKYGLIFFWCALCLQTPCSDSPCVNGGTCIALYHRDDFKCNCPPRFEGKYCEIGKCCGIDVSRLCLHGRPRYFPSSDYLFSIWVIPIIRIFICNRVGKLLAQTRSQINISFPSRSSHEIQWSPLAQLNVNVTVVSNCDQCVPNMHPLLRENRLSPGRWSHPFYRFFQSEPCPGVVSTTFSATTQVESIPSNQTDKGIFRFTATWPQTEGGGQCSREGKTALKTSTWGGVSTKRGLETCPTSSGWALTRSTAWRPADRVSCEWR